MYDFSAAIRFVVIVVALIFAGLGFALGWWLT